LVVVDSIGSEWSIDGNDARVLRNHVSGSTEFSLCLSIRGNRNRVADNVVSGCPQGDLVLLAGSDNALIGNEALEAGADGSHSGIAVGQFTAGTLLQDNFAHDNDVNGITVLAPATRLQGNRADDNGALGIDAVAGVTDLGGNTASGNGDPLQCRNIFCAPGP
jgi:hypothetical protein